MISNVPEKTSEKSLRKLFQEHGEIDKVWLKQTDEGAQNAYLTFQNKIQAEQAAQKMTTIHFKNSDAHVEAPKKDGDSIPNDYQTSIYIQNLPLVLNEKELRNNFKNCGQIISTHIIRDPDTFIGKGIAFIKFSNEKEMEKAIEDLDESVFKGRTIRVKKAIDINAGKKRPKTKKIKKHRNYQDFDRSNQVDEELQNLGKFVVNARKGLKGNGMQEKVKDIQNLNLIYSLISRIVLQ